jgi:sortase A
MKIILYDYRWQEEKAKAHKAKRASRFGYGLLIVSLAIFTLTLGPVILTEMVYRLEKDNQALSQEITANEASASLSPQAVAQEAAQYGVKADFSLVIPKLGIAAQVIANVNPADEKSYRDALKQGVGHAAGSQFPGNPGTTYLFAHSSDLPTNLSPFSKIFYLLKEVVPGDKIIVFFGGQKFEYQAVDNFITAADDTRWLTEEENQEKLVLQTCWPPGTALKRLIVTAQRI